MYDFILNSMIVVAVIWIIAMLIDIYKRKL